MYEIVRLAITIIVVALGVLWGIKISRATLSTGIESFHGRLLLSSAIAAAIFCALIVIGFCGIWAFLIYRYADVISYPFDLITMGALLLFPFSVILNFWLAPDRLTKKYGLKPCVNPDICRHIKYLAETLLIDTPVIMTSSRIEMPFVFGRATKHAVVAIPYEWQQRLPSASVPMLLHELAHIRNKDVGFLGWAFAFIADSGIILAGLTVILMWLMLGQKTAIPAVKSAYVASIFSIAVLRLMYVLVLKDRELLADRTVAAVLAREKLVQTIELEQWSILISSTPVRPYAATGATALCVWLADKALFGNYRWFWNIFHKCVNCFNASHPPLQERIKIVEHFYDSTEPLKMRFRDCFLCGLALGMILSFSCLAGFWFAKYVMGIDGDIDSIQVSWYSIYIISLVIATVVLINASIPIWTSLHAIHLNRSYFKIIATSYVSAFLGIACGSCLVVTNGLYERATWLTLLLAVVWNFYVLFFVFIFNIVLTGVWIEFRYFSKRNLQAILLTMWLVAVPLAVIIAILTAGILLFCSGSTSQLGALIILSSLVGLICTMLFLTASTCDYVERYVIIPAGYKAFKIEGPRCEYKSMILMSMVWVVSFTIPCVTTFGIIYILLQWFKLHFVSYIWASVLLLIAISVYFLMGHPQRRMGMRRYQLFLLFESCRLLNPLFPVRQSGFLEQQLNHFSMRWGRLAILSKIIIRADMLFQIVSLNHSSKQVPWRQDVEKFITACENDKGFALWPSGTSRLSSTYFTLSTMQKLGISPLYPATVHVSWVQSYQQADGAFTDPANLRPAYENTYFAIMALNLLGHQLNTPEMERCRQWALSELQLTGNSDEDISRIYHCSAVADMLGLIPSEVMEQLWRWTQQQLRISLLLNPVHDAESIFYVLNVNALCRRYNPRYVDDAYQETIEILSKKVEAAFFAELKNVRL